MTDQDPTEPADVDATQMMPATTVVDPPDGPIGPAGPGGGDRPFGPNPDRRWWWILGVLGVLMVLLVVFLLLDQNDDDSTVASVSSTTSSSTSTTEETTTTTGAPAVTPSTTSTTASPTSSTVAPARCTGDTNPSDPKAPARTLYDAWRIDDRDCADRVASTKAADKLFKLKTNGPEWQFQGCQEKAEPDPHFDCAFTYEGGAAHFLAKYGAVDGWQVYDIEFVAD